MHELGFLFVIFLVFRKTFLQLCLQNYSPDVIYKVDRGILFTCYLLVLHFVVKPLLSVTLTQTSCRPNGVVFVFSPK